VLRAAMEADPRSLPAAIGGIPENICSPRFLLTVTHGGHAENDQNGSSTLF
jgi:hypothetical protein